MELAKTTAGPEQLLELALRSGAEAAEVAVETAFSQPVVFEANRLKQLETSETAAMALRVWRQGQPGVAVAAGAVPPQQLVDKALALSELGTAETPALSSGGTHTFPTMGEPVPVEQLIEVGERAIATIRAAYPDVLCEASLSSETTTTRLINSQGLDYRYGETSLSVGLSAEWVRGDDFLAVGEDAVSRTVIDPDALAQSVVERLRWAERSAAPVTGQLPVVLTAQAADLLWETVQAALNGRRWVEGASPWCQGQRVAQDALTLWQDPSLGPYSCPFDDEGRPTQRLPLVTAGRVAQPYCDRTVGEALGFGSTGNGFRPGLGSRATPGLVNLWVQPGDRSMAELLKDLPEAVVVDQVMGGGAGLAGDLSVNLDLGYYLHRGEIVGRLKDTMVSGNVYKALQQVAAVASHPVWCGAYHTPALVVEGLTTVG